MKYPKMKFVFDHYKTASKKTKGSVQIVVTSERKRKWVSTGVRLFSDQWDERNHVVRHNDCVQLNLKLDAIMKGIADYVNDLILRGVPFTFDDFDAFLKSRTESRSFLTFVSERIEERNDITESTKKQHRAMLKSITEFGKLNYMHDLTSANVHLYDNWLRARPIGSGTVYSYHKRLKTYINDALCQGLIDKYPYAGMNISRKSNNIRRFLNENELQSVATCRIQRVSIEHARDLFLFQCYTGLAYSDMMQYDFKRNIECRNGKYVVQDRRVKTGETYYIVLLTPAVKILEKYNYELPRLTNQVYNAELKVLAGYASLNKNLTSHMARHTFAVFALNKGVPIEVVSKMLGHTNIRTTQIYAKLHNSSVEKGFATLEKYVGESVSSSFVHSVLPA